MLERLLMAGEGGQGIILAGRLLATAAVKKSPFVTFFPAYGAEVRGGTSHCQVVLSTKEIGSPLTDVHDSMIILNQASAKRFAPQANRRCMVLVNSSLCPRMAKTAAIFIPATEMANQLGDTRVANFIMLGAYLSRKPIVEEADIEKGIENVFSGKNRALIDLNIQAFRAGLTT